MGLFDNLKNHSDDRATPSDKKVVMVDDIFMISVPKEWNQFESDRFRMKNAAETIQLTITNYAMHGVNNDYNIEDLKSRILPLLNKFVVEGGYESLNDLQIGNNFIYQSFKVDEETQYYYYTWRNVRQSQFVMSAFIIRAVGTFDAKLKETLIGIGSGLMHKVSYK